MGEALRDQAGVKTRAKDRTSAGPHPRPGRQARLRQRPGPALRGRLRHRARPRCGSPSSAAASTPSIRRAGFAPLRLDLAQDAGFAAATIPLGIGLHRKTDQ